MRNISDRSCRGNQNTHFVFCDLFFFFENRAVYEIMWKNIVKPDRAHTLQYVACALHAGYLRLQTHTHTLTHNMYYVLLFHCTIDCKEGASMLRCTYIACLLSTNIVELLLRVREYQTTAVLSRVLSEQLVHNRHFWKLVSRGVINITFLQDLCSSSFRPSLRPFLFLTPYKCHD
jgi:hypothetical protein